MRTLTRILIPFYILLATILLIKGLNEESVRMMVRLTAKVAMLFFILAFTGSIWPKIKPGRWATLNLLQYKYWIWGFGLVHFTHLASIYVLSTYDTNAIAQRWPVGAIGGGVAYLFLTWMMLSSTDWAIRNINASIRHKSHRVGSYYIALVFASSYIPRALEHWYYIPWALIIVTVLWMRLRFDLRTKR